MTDNGKQIINLVDENKNLKIELDLYSAGINQLEKLTYDLQQSEESYRLLYEYAAVGIGYYESDGTIISFNNLAAKNMGGLPNDFAGKSIFDIFPKSSAETYLRRIQKALTSSKQIEYEDCVDLPSGKRYFLTVLSKISNPNSNINRVQIISQDITERKNEQQQILETKIRYESILDSIGDAVFACDVNGKIILFNKMAEQMTGVSISKAIGENHNKIINFINDSNGKSSDDIVAEVIKNNKIIKIINHVELVRTDGQKIPVTSIASPIHYANKTIGCVVVMRDVTQERRIDIAKTEFVSLASHQLRTPLSTINWYSEMLLSSDIGNLTPTQNQYTKQVYQASVRMVDLVNALLNVSRLELGTFAINPSMVNVVMIVKKCIKNFSLQISKKKLVIKQEFDNKISEMKIDPQLFDIVVQNLLSNSIKYSSDKGVITISIKRDNDNIILAVADKGVGIPQGQQKDIFKKLFRADNAKIADPDGSGLGLYIVKEIVDNAGGKIWFMSNKKKGTIFSVSIPLSGMVKKEGNKYLL